MDRSLRRKLLLALAVLPAIPGMALPAVAELAGTENEPLIGAAFEILREAYRRIGIEAVDRQLPGERSLTALNAGEYTGDVMHIAGLEQRYPNLLRIPVPIIHTDAALIARSDWPQSAPAGWAELEPYSICIRRGIKAIEGATEKLSRVSSVSQYENIMRMVRLGRCDATVVPSSAWLAVDLIELKGLREVKSMQRWPLYHYVHKAHADLVPLLTTVLQAMQRSGYLAERQAAFEQRLEVVRRAALRQGGQ